MFVSTQGGSRGGLGEQTPVDPEAYPVGGAFKPGNRPNNPLTALRILNCLVIPPLICVVTQETIVFSIDDVVSYF